MRAGLRKTKKGPPRSLLCAGLAGIHSMSKGTTKDVELPKQFSAEITELNDGRVVRLRINNINCGQRLARRSSGDWVISLFGLVRPGLGFTGCISGWTLYRSITRISRTGFCAVLSVSRPSPYFGSVRLPGFREGLCSSVHSRMQSRAALCAE